MTLYLLSLLLAAFTNFALLATHDYCTVFVHIGSDIPSYTIIALEQFRLFNPSCPLYFISQNKNLQQINKTLENNKVIGVATETLNKTPEHIQFLQTSTLNRTSAKGFWLYTSERFFYLEEFIIQYKPNSILHLENDVMIYRNVEELLPTLRKHYRGIAMTFSCDYFAVPGFMYIPSLKAIHEITAYLTAHASEAKNDGELLTQLKDEKGPQCIDYLPAIFPQYAQKYALVNSQGKSAQQPERFYQFSDEFPGIFDAGPIGQYLGGLSPLNGSLPAGFINSYSIFNPQLLSFVWHKDSCGRKVPYAKFGDGEYLINNLHVHSKKLENFRS